ncbi:MAG: LON peptidase substrate-binding domain-containing protein [Phycisphaerales bacterium]|nr:LON peptidase substrate-binding domain-containing protein [Phycisphaerales bacterium]
MTGDQDHAIRVDFSEAFGLFPLHGVVLLPHAVLKLHIFEPRYRQMVAAALDGSNQIAMASFLGDDWKTAYEGAPPLRRAVCIGSIAQHRRLPDGRFNILLQGVCRARIAEEEEPEGERLYRRARLVPIGDSLHETPVALAEHELEIARSRLEALVRARPLVEVKSVRRLIDDLAENSELPTPVFLELVALRVLSTFDDTELLYRLLDEGDTLERARLTEHALHDFRSVLVRAERQFDPQAPDGISWN